MQSLRTKTTLLTVCAIVASVAIVTLLSVYFIRNAENQNSNKMLLLLCETGKENLDFYFEGVEKSVEKVADYIDADLAELEGSADLKNPDPEELKEHMDRAKEYFGEIANRTNGVLTYYYRIDPAFSDTEKGFWYTNLDGEEFTEHEVTDITLYDTEDTSSLVWFTVPKYEGRAIWLSPYITENLDKRVISYNVPIYWNDRFIGVIGMEIDYSTMAEQVNSIKLYDNGYAFINDPEGTIIYHSLLDVTQLTEETHPPVPDGLISDDTYVRYTYDGVEKQAVWLPLSNGMRLNVAVPVSEIGGDWQKLIEQILIASLIVLLIVSILITRFTNRLTKPLLQLTRAAEQVDQENYDIKLDYDKDDEIGTLTRTFKRLAGHVKDHINELSKRVYVDALTGVRNKAAYTDYLDELQKKLDRSDGEMEFAVCVFDCDDLKLINDEFGHDKGDIYLKKASQIICQVFQHSPVFRIGGDEFSAILQNEDFEKREELVHIFYKTSQEICAQTPNKWEQVRVTLGLAVYDPEIETTVSDVVRQADKDMYEYKRLRKKGRIG